MRVSPPCSRLGYVSQRQILFSAFATVWLAAHFVALPSSAVVTIDWVRIGNPGSAGVDYSFEISRNEVTNAQYAEFLNSVDPSGANALGLYNSSMGSDANNGGINFVPGNAAGARYVVKATGGYFNASVPATGFANKPVTYVSFWDALRFANWLNNGQTFGGTENGAYTMSFSFPTRNVGALVFLPSPNEWNKAALYDPASGTSFAFAVGTNVLDDRACYPPVPTARRANCGGPLVVGMVTDVGSYTGSPSPYGTFDQNGNVWEWTDGAYLLQPVARGGSWNDGVFTLRTENAYFAVLDHVEYPNIGFRIARDVGCDDDIDNDGDGLVDFPADPGCDSPTDMSERSPALACDDDIDDDGDGRAAFPADPGCESPTEESEQSLALVCDDGIDNDGDERADFPADPGCTGPAADSEVGACEDGIDNDGDGLADFSDDPGCDSANDQSERSTALACDDGIDNDFDVLSDYPADPECHSSTNGLEVSDVDSDAVPPSQDDCARVSNPSQLDSDYDGYGNACDGDYDNDGVVGFADFARFRLAFGATTGGPYYDPVVDANGDGGIGLREFALMRSSFGKPPGPSGLACAAIGNCYCQLIGYCWGGF